MKRVPPASTIAALIVMWSSAGAVADDSAALSATEMTGTVTGHLVDGSTQEGLPAATIHVVGGSSAVAEIDGTYSVTLAPGSYTLVFSTPEYVEQHRTVTIAPQRSVTLDLALVPVARTGKAETIEVHGALDTRKDSAVLAERRASAAVSDAVSAQQIARSPDANASDAAKRIVAATIQDNRYLVVRGLGGRYSTTLLNGVQLPSPDPDVPAAPLDLFPASLVTNLTINKTFLPDMPGNFAGCAWHRDPQLSNAIPAQGSGRPRGEHDELVPHPERPARRQSRFLRLRRRQPCTAACHPRRSAGG